MAPAVCYRIALPKLDDKESRCLLNEVRKVTARVRLVVPVVPDVEITLTPFEPIVD